MQTRSDCRQFPPKQPTSFDTYNNDIAPIGEVVRTRVEGEDRDGRGGPIFDNLRDLPLANDFPSSSPDPTTPNPNPIQTTQPIQIDPFNGGGDVDLTNGIDGNAVENDIDLTGTTVPPPPPAPITRVPTLFAGYEDVEYDPSVYAYEYDYEGEDDDGITIADEVPDLLGINGLNSGAPNFGIPGTQPNEDEDTPYSAHEEDDSRRRGKEVNPTFVPAEYVDDDDDDVGGGGPAEFLEYSELLSEGQGVDGDGDGKADEDVAFISVPLKIEELGGVTRDTRNSRPACHSESASKSFASCSLI